MRIIFEEYQYEAPILNENLDAEYYTNVGAGKAKTTFVGYYYSQRLNDSVFILPKVFVQKNTIFGHTLEDVVCIESANVDDKDKNILFNLSVWIYLAIKRFAANNEKTGITNQEYIQNVISNGDTNFATYLDIVLQLIRFHRENSQLLAFTTMMSKKHNDHTCWTKTINRRLPFLQNGAPIYMDAICKTKELDLDEELIVLFYSVLRYLQQKFCFRLSFELNYNLFPTSKIANLIENGGGKAMLKRIRHKYFKDVFVQLWNILYAFFDKANKIESSTSKPDVLIAKDFNIIFEAMVDQLVSDTEVVYLKNQKDGKIVDHIFKYKSIVSGIESDEVFYILDSKYYKDDNIIGENSIYKQFTYARNIIYEFRKQYRDEITEGYDITPNFFIRGYVATKENEYVFDELKLEYTKNEYLSNHFENRLFDRDTLMALEYKANLLYILVSYVQDHQESGIKEKFRKQFQKVVAEHYNFYYIDFKSNDELERFVEQNFKKINGKIMRYPKNNGLRLYLAEEKAKDCSGGECSIKYGRFFYSKKLINANSSKKNGSSSYDSLNHS